MKVGWNFGENEFATCTQVANGTDSCIFVSDDLTFQTENISKKTITEEKKTTIVSYDIGSEMYGSLMNTTGIRFTFRRDIYVCDVIKTQAYLPRGGQFGRNGNYSRKKFKCMGVIIVAPKIVLISPRSGNTIQELHSMQFTILLYAEGYLVPSMLQSNYIFQQLGANFKHVKIDVSCFPLIVLYYTFNESVTEECKEIQCVIIFSPYNGTGLPCYSSTNIEHKNVIITPTYVLVKKSNSFDVYSKEFRSKRTYEKLQENSRHCASDYDIQQYKYLHGNNPPILYHLIERWTISGTLISSSGNVITYLDNNNQEISVR